MRVLNIFILVIILPLFVYANNPRYRILVSTDIGGTDPDDNQSMIHLLMYANEFDIEGLVSSPSFGEGSKDEILRMIDEYEVDLPKLQQGMKAAGIKGVYPKAEELRAITKQGRKGSASLKGYDCPTEGSEWIVSCAQKDDSRPLWVLVWGTLEDVAQALHDAPDIADRIRVYWVGGPNKKWGCNSYNYIAENFPNVWFIENNASYRGFIGNSNDNSLYGNGYWQHFMSDAGVMGNDFKNYYKGNVKMGDTPSLLYLMYGDPEVPTDEHWGGRFAAMDYSPKYILKGAVTERDTISVYSMLEWQLDGPDTGIPTDSACFELVVDKQVWPGYHVGGGKYVVRYAPKGPAILNYVITSSIDGFPAHKGTLNVVNEWPALRMYQTNSANIESRHIALNHQKWFTDVSPMIANPQCAESGRYANIDKRWPGASTVAKWRQTVLKDWAERFMWLK